MLIQIFENNLIYRGYNSYFISQFYSSFFFYTFIYSTLSNTTKQLILINIHYHHILTMNNLICSLVVGILLIGEVTSTTPQYSNKTISNIADKSTLPNKLGFSVENINIEPSAVIMNVSNIAPSSVTSSTPVPTTYYSSSSKPLQVESSIMNWIANKNQNESGSIIVSMNTEYTNLVPQISSIYRNNNQTVISTLQVGLLNSTSIFGSLLTPVIPTSTIDYKSYNNDSVLTSGFANNTGSLELTKIASVLPTAQVENTNYTSPTKYGNSTYNTTYNHQYTSTTTSSIISNITSSQIGYSNATSTLPGLYSSRTLQRQDISSSASNSNATQVYINSTMSSNTLTRTPTKYLNITSAFTSSGPTQYSNLTSSLVTQPVPISYNSSISKTSGTHTNISSTQAIYHNSTNSLTSTNIIEDTSLLITTNVTMTIARTNSSSFSLSTTSVTEQNSVTTQWPSRNASSTQKSFDSMSSYSNESSTDSIQNSNLTTSSNTLTNINPHFSNTSITTIKPSYTNNNTISIPGGMANVNVTYSVAPETFQQSKGSYNISSSTSSYVASLTISGNMLNSTIMTSAKFENSSFTQPTSSYSAIFTGVSKLISTYQTGQVELLTTDNGYNSTLTSESTVNYANTTSTASSSYPIATFSATTGANKDSNPVSATIKSLTNGTSSLKDQSVTSSFVESVNSDIISSNGTQHKSSIILASSMDPANISQNYYANTTSTSSTAVSTVPILSDQNNNVNPTGSLKFESATSESTIKSENTIRYTTSITSSIDSPSAIPPSGSSKLLTPIASVDATTNYIHDIDPKNPIYSSNVSSITSTVMRAPSTSTTFTLISSLPTAVINSGISSSYNDSVQLSKSLDPQQSSVSDKPTISADLGDSETLSFVDSIFISSDVKVTASTSTISNSAVESNNSLSSANPTEQASPSTNPTEQASPSTNPTEQAVSSIDHVQSIRTNESNNLLIAENSSKSGSQKESNSATNSDVINNNTSATASVSDSTQATTMTSVSAQLPTDSSFITSTITSSSATSRATHSSIEYTGSASNVIISFGHAIIVPILLTISFM